MKKLSLLIIVHFVTFTLICQQQYNNSFITQCSALNTNEIEIKFNNSYITSVNGELSLSFSCKILDTCSFEKLNFHTGFFLSFNDSDFLPLDTGVTYTPDSSTYTINLYYDTSNIPFTFQEINFSLSTNKEKYDFTAYIFFEGKNSINIYNIETFLSLDRHWLIPINNDSLEMSYGIPTNDTIPYLDTLLPYQYIQVPGKSYAVPINIDTTEYEYSSRGILTTFKGLVRGKAIHPYNNGTIDMNLEIAGLRVDVWEATGGFAANKHLGSTYTDNEGDFEIEYERNKINLDGNIQIFVAFSARSQNRQVDVVRGTGAGGYETYTVFTGNINHPHNGGDIVTFELGTVGLERASCAQVLHWAQKEIDFIKSETESLNLNFTSLRISPYSGWSHYAMNGGVQIPSGIELSFIHIDREDVVHHEVGHYIHLKVLQNGKRQENAGGTHTFAHNNKHPNQTITEGIANAIEYCTDARFFTDDQEFNIQAHRRNSVNINTHPFTAELLYTQTILDLYDDIAKFETFGILGQQNLISDVGIDNASFSMLDILKPFNQHKSSDAQTIQDVGQYFRQLVQNVNLCTQKRAIKQVMDYNLQNLFNPSMNTILSTDVVCRFETIEHRDDNLSMDSDFNLVEGTPIPYNYNYWIIDHTELNSTANSFNFGNSSQQTQYSLNYLSDNLNISNSAYLGFNANKRVLFEDQNLNHATQNSTLNIDVCAETINLSNGEIILGFVDGNTNSIVKIKEGSSLVLNGNTSTLTINNNSSLIIEPGGTLIIHPGAQIILNGPNAVLHIKGKIILEVGADFNPIAGANGFGKIIFENNINEFQIYPKSKNKIIINPVTKPTNPNQFNLVIIGKVAIATRLPRSFGLLEINNANVLISDNSILTSRAAQTNINNSTIMGEINKQSIGIEAIESIVKLTQTRFEWLETAFENKLNNDRGVRQEITNCQFIKCKTGVKMNGGHAKIEGCLFNWFGRYGNYGVQAYSTGSTNIFLDNVFQLPSNPTLSNGNQMSKSLEHWGQSAKVFRNVFVDGNTAVNNYDGTMLLECNHFASWTFRELSYNAIRSQNGTLRMDVGRNLLAHYQTYLNSRNSQLFLKDGANLFLLGQGAHFQYPFNLELRQNQLLNLQPSATHTGRIDPINDKAFLATGNYWKESGNPDIYDFRPFPDLNSNMYITDHSTGTSNFDLGFLIALSSSNYVSDQSSFCTPRYTDIDKPFIYVYEIKEFDDVSSEFTIPISDPKKPTTITDDIYIDVIANTFEKINEDVIDYNEVLPEIIYITQLSLPDTLREVATFVYDLSHQVFQHSLTDTTSSDSLREARRTYFGEMMLSAQDTLIARSFGSDSFWLSMRYELLRDKAEILRAINRRTEAIAVLDAAIIDTTLSNLKKSHATTWRCFINQEQDLLDSVITIEELDFALCLPEDSLQVHSPYTFVEADTTFSLCHPDSLSGENLTMQYFVADTTLPYVMYTEMADTIFTVAPHQYTLPVGKFTFIAIDTLDKVYHLTYIEVGTNTDCHPIFQTSDTLYSICNLNPDSLHHWYPIEVHLTHEVYDEYSSPVYQHAPYLYKLTEGNYTIMTYDSFTNTYHTASVAIEVNFECHPDTIFQTSDTMLYFCNDGIKSYDSLYVWYPIESHLIHEVYLGGVTLVNPYIPYLYQLRAGTYTIITYDSNSLTHHTASVAVSPNYIDVSYYSNTFSYDCELGYYGLNIYDNLTLVYDENDDLVTETSTNYYELDAVNHQYKTIYTNLETCESEETTLHFIDEYYLPESAEADIYGDFNTETDTCAFFKVDELLCNGNAINSSPTIEVFDISGVHLLTTSFVYHETRGNGFYFCPPYWNNEPEHIYDWYSLVIRTDFCDYCRFDFRYDSTGIYDRSSSLTNATLIKNRVMLYPNPANQDVNIHFLGVAETGLETITIQILDQTGRILEDKVHALNKYGNIKLSMEQYTNGVYFIKIPALKYDGKVVLIKE